MDEIRTGPQVVYVYGTGRNGSTILGQMLGSQASWIHAGEIMTFWWAGMLENRICECGVRFQECEFWSAVVAEAHVTRAEALDAAEEFHASCRIRHAPGALAKNEWPQQDVELRFRERTVRLYQAIARISGASVIVDTSKMMTYGALVSTAFDTLALYLVRDPRAVAYSYEHTKADPSLGDGGMMNEGKAWRSAITWQAYEFLVPLLTRRFATDSITLRYEDLVSTPDRITGEIQRRLGGRPEEVPTEASVVTGHTIAGNPIRFDSGSLDIRLDRRWLSDRSWRREFVVDALCWAGMVRHGYRLSVDREGTAVR